MEVWIVFDGNVPECGKYKRAELEWLAESLCGFENDKEAEAVVLAELLALELGVVKKIRRRVVKVQWSF